MVAKIFLNGVFTILITFGTAFLSIATDMQANGKTLGDISDISWSIMVVGALIAGFTQWKGFTSNPPEK